MKKAIALILAVILAATLVSCAGQKTQTETAGQTETTAEALTTDSAYVTDSAGDTDSAEDSGSVSEAEPEVDPINEEREALRSFEIDDGVDRPYPKTDLVKKFEYYRERGFLKNKFEVFTVLLYKDSHRDLKEISASMFPEIEGIEWIGPYHENESSLINSLVSPDDPCYDVPAVFTILIRISPRDADAFLEILEKLNEREDIADFDAELNFKTSFPRQT